MFLNAVKFDAKPTCTSHTHTKQRLTIRFLHFSLYMYRSQKSISDTGTLSTQKRGPHYTCKTTVVYKQSRRRISSSFSASSGQEGFIILSCYTLNHEIQSSLAACSLAYLQVEIKVIVMRICERNKPDVSHLIKIKHQRPHKMLIDFHLASEPLKWTNQKWLEYVSRYLEDGLVHLVCHLTSLELLVK